MKFEAWLATATHGLAPDAAERIRLEIGDHYHSALAAGASSAQALTTLGDPQQANRDYRRVFLTEKQAAFARALDLPAKRPLFLKIGALLYILAWTAIPRFRPHNFWGWACIGAVFAHALLMDLFPPINAQRSLRYLVADFAGITVLIGMAAAAALESQWPFVFIFGCLTFMIAIFPTSMEWYRWTVLRKLGRHSLPSN
jgi:hypothetical protein